MKKVVAIVSGGLDSTTVLGMLMEEKIEVYPLTFNYGQRHVKENHCIYKVIEFYRHKKTNAILHPLEQLNLPKINCLLTSPRDLPEGDVNREGIAPTYVPGRNSIFIAHALSYAEVNGAEEVYLGVNHIDYSGYPDCRPEFINEWNELCDIGTKAGVEGDGILIYAPLMEMTKTEIINVGFKLEVPYQLTWSCYRGGKYPCRKCDSCKIRIGAFKSINRRDPLFSKDEWFVLTAPKKKSTKK